MIINSFIQNNRKYVYVLENGKIKFGYKENNKIKYDLNDKEIDFMKYKISILKCELKTEIINGINFLFFLLLSANIISNHFPYSDKLMTYAIEKNDDLTDNEKEFLLSKLYIL